MVIAGSLTEELQIWHQSLDTPRRNRVRLAGKVGRDDLAAILDASQVFYSPSAFESFGIAAAEALCSGCSVVAGRSVSMAGFEWFVSGNSGTLAEKNDAEGHLTALRHELGLWRKEMRNPRQISDVWSERLHASQVAARIISLKERGNPAREPRK